MTTKDVWVDLQLVDPPLSPQQLTLLLLLYENVGQVIPRNRIIKEVWPGIDPAGVSSDAVNGLIKRLRKRLRQT
ncbi:MAG: winged helix-turn-helix domain-containing protein, partial [Anaerolineales bacterium]